MADRSLLGGAEPCPRREEAPEWGYEEGVEWGLLFPEANGEYQSPINLNSREAKYDPSLLDVRLSPNYVVCRDCEVINDGHSIQIALKSKSVLIGGPLPRGHEFELHDVRFHWGRENQRGSEHTVNFKAFPMEVDFRQITGNSGELIEQQRFINQKESREVISTSWLPGVIYTIKFVWATRPSGYCSVPMRQEVACSL